jgi:hypothetical protein
VGQPATGLVKDMPLTDEQIENRLAMLEQMIARANPKDLPYLNATFQRLLDERVQRKLDKKDRK